MTIILPNDYHARQLLEENRIYCLSTHEARQQDIRPLRVGILNIMPECEDFEFNILHPLGLSIIQVVPVWIKLKSHQYSSSNQEHIHNLYVTYEEALRDGGLDGLIVTGAPVETLDFSEVMYWDEISAILRDARTRLPSTLGLCWGALALAYLEGIDKLSYNRKLFGVFEIRNLSDRTHPITGELDDLFFCPQSRNAGIDDRLLEEARDAGRLNLLAHSADCGYVIFESPDHRVVMHTGHPEYNSQRLVNEYQRDKLRGLTGPAGQAGQVAGAGPSPGPSTGAGMVGEPVNFDLANPTNRWKSHRNIFFMQWLKYCYMSISMGGAGTQ